MFHGALFLCCTILIQIIWAALYSVPLQELREPSTTLSHTRLMNIPPLLLMHTQTLFHRLQWIKNCSSDFSESHKEALNLQLNACGTRETLGKIAHGDVNVSQGPTETVRERKWGDDNETYGWSVEKGVNNRCKVREAETNELKGKTKIEVGEKSQSVLIFMGLGLWMNEWMNEWMMHLYSALMCIAVHPSTLQSCGGGGLSSTTTSVQHPLGWLAMIDKGEWREFGQDTGVTPLFFTRSVMGFVMTTESQDLVLTSHPKDGFMLLIPCYNKDVHQSWKFMRAWDKIFNKFKIWVQKCTCMRYCLLYLWF